MIVGSWLSFLTHLLSVVVLIRIPRGAHGRITVKVTVIVSSIAWQKERSAKQCRVEGERKRTAGSESDERSNKYFFLKKSKERRDTDGWRGSKMYGEGGRRGSGSVGKKGAERRELLPREVLGCP